MLLLFEHYILIFIYYNNNIACILTLLPIDLSVDDQAKFFELLRTKVELAKG